MTSHRRIARLRFTVLFAALVLVGGAARAAGPATANQPQPALVVAVVTPTRADVADRLPANGNITA